MRILPKEEERELFRNICLEDASAGGDGEFNTENEKRLHRVLKRFSLERLSNIVSEVNEYDGYEVKIGRYIADILYGGYICEIQTGSLRPLLNKLKYYLENTDYKIIIICPVRSATDILRIDKESGELIRKRRSPKRESVEDKISDLIYLSDIFNNDRIRLVYISLTLTVQRYSERMRYRKKGSFDAEIFPEALVEYELVEGKSDIRGYIPEELMTPKGFSASEYGERCNMNGRKLYNTLNFFCNIGLLCKKKEEGHFIYYPS